MAQSPAPGVLTALAIRVARIAFGVLLLGAAGAMPARGQDLPPPATLPDGPPNLFFGAVPPSPPHVAEVEQDVIVFLHGLNGVAMNWWVDSDMYAYAYRAGFRTAFISMSADNTANATTFVDNGETFASLLPLILEHYKVSQVHVVGHSKGGLDAQAAMVKYPQEVGRAVKALFTISTPNQGSELADWLFDTEEGQIIGTGFGLLTPGVASLRLANVAAFRAQADPVLKELGVPIYTMYGDLYLNNLVTAVTGGILKRLVPEQFNDGFVTGARSRLSSDLASDLGRLRTHHFDTDSGHISFAKVNARLQALEYLLDEFKKVSAGGWGDDSNTWIWSMAWFKGKLYVGTGREIECISVMTADVQVGSNLYPLGALDGHCPAGDELFLSLRAEIWQYTPETTTWKRVYQSPVMEAGTDGNGLPAYTARDVGYRGMSVFVEPGGREVLYVGGVTSGSIYENLAPHAGRSYPPPRLLRSEDGEQWDPVPQDPGTFLGDIANPPPGSTRKSRSFRALTPFKGKLFATIGDFRGLGYVVVSERPWEGNDAWQQASPTPEEMPVWNLKVFHDHLYMTTGDRDYSDAGFGLYKLANAEPPFVWQPVITDGAYQTNADFRAPNGLSFAVFQDQLYLGTNRPTELYRINPDDTWDLIVGEPRMTPMGYKTPLSGLGAGFGSWFNGHFWRMGTHSGRLYLTTWDSSAGADFLPGLDQIFGFQYGFDFFRTDDGIHWTAITRNGMEDGGNTGGRSVESTPVGLFVGTARQTGGGTVYQCLDPSCTLTPTNPAVPTGLWSESEQTAGRQVRLRWNPVPGAVRYRIYRATVLPITTFLPKPQEPIQLAEGVTVTLEEIRNGALDYLCGGDAELDTCAKIRALADTPTFIIGLPSPFVQVAAKTDPTFEETAPTEYQSIYFVRAEDAGGVLSPASNFVGAPSKADQTPPELTVPPVITVAVDPSASSAVIPLEATATDNSGGTVIVKHDAPAGFVFPLGTTTVTWTATDGTLNTTLVVQQVNVVRAVTTDDDGLPDDWEERFGLNPLSGQGDDGPAGDPDGDGRSNLEEYRDGTHPRGIVAEYFAEGATGTFFDVTLALANPGLVPVRVLLRYERPDGTWVSEVVEVPPQARRTVNPEAAPGLAATAFSTVVEADKPVVVDRTMTWGEGYGSHAETGVPSPAQTWYLAEGATHSGFQVFYLMQNPGPRSAQVTVEYLRPAPLTPVTKVYTVAAESRRSVWLNLEPELAAMDVAAVVTSDEPIVMERAMYRDGPGQPLAAGHASAAVVAPATTWMFAEGATGPYFDTFLLIANPGPAAATLTVEYLLPDGTVETRGYTVAGRSRFNIWVDQEGGRLANTAMAMRVTSTNGVPVVAERAMWWPGPAADTWMEAHVTAGATAMGEAWGLAEGACGAGVETYVLVANLGSTTARVQATVLFEDGTAPLTTVVTVPATSRSNLVPALLFPGLCPAEGTRRFGMVLESLPDGAQAAAPIVVERAMYSDAQGAHWAAGTAAFGARLR